MSISNYYNVQELADEYSKYGKMELNSAAGIARLVPFVEHRVEIIVDESVPDEMEVDDIPPHLKQTIDLYFVNAEALHPAKYMIRCSAPGKLQTYSGKVWQDIPYRNEFQSWEGYIDEMENIHYPFIVLPNKEFIPRSFLLIQNNKMELFKSILNGPNRQVLLSEFESRWVHLFHPDAIGTEAYPLDAWIHVAESHNAYVDVVTPNGDGTVNIVFTVPPIMSLNQGRSSVVKDDLPISVESLVKRCSSESNVIPRSGDGRFLETMSGMIVNPEETNKHYQMWRKIYKYYGWKITGEEDDVKEVVEEKKRNAGNEADPFKLASIKF